MCFDVAKDPKVLCSKNSINLHLSKTTQEMYNSSCTQIIVELESWTLVATWREFEWQGWFNGQCNAIPLT